jgi:type I restriction enzyme S subunit
MSFPRYPAYKDSGVVWLGEIPLHWDVKPMKWVIERSDGGVWGNDPTGEDDTVVLRSTEQTVDGRWQLDEPALRSLSETEKAGSLLATGDLLVTKSSGSALHIGKTTLVTPEVAALVCCYSNFMQRLRLKSGFDSRLAWYLMNNEIARTQFDLLSNSTTGLANLNGTILGELVTPIPSVDEQAAIVEFLDRETAKIDALVAEQEQLITLLKEKRQAVISHAVTKGLDPSVPMKDSGVEWLGEVPAHWEVTHLKRRCSLITDGAHISPETEGGVHLFVSTKDISDDGIDFDGALRTSPASYEYMVKTGCQPTSGDVLFSKDGTIGRTVVVNGATEFVVASSLIVIRPIPDQLNSDFLNALCQSWVVSQQVDGFVKGAGLPRLSIQNLLKVIGVFPPIDEQVQIASYLSDLDLRSRTLALEAERTVTLLKERRSALISAAVTGQIDVRGLA